MCPIISISQFFLAPGVTLVPGVLEPSLREKCPNTEFSLVFILLYSVRIQEKTDQNTFHAVHPSLFHVNSM